LKIAANFKEIFRIEINFEDVSKLFVIHDVVNYI